MTWLRLAWANLALSPVSSAVNILLMTLGTASIVLLILAGERFTDTLSRDARGIDLVLGAKGSPTQLILSAVYHADLPTGNIDYAEASKWAGDHRIALAAPLSLGDSYRGFRIVGTQPTFFELFGVAVTEGGSWESPMQAVIGATVAHELELSPGDQFSSAHGFTDVAHEHESRPYTVVGVMPPLGTVLDRLILTSLDSVWVLHDEHHDDDHERQNTKDDQHVGHSDRHAHIADHEENHEKGIESNHHDAINEREITAMLLRYQSPLAAITLPREINAMGKLQAAAPPVEIARVLSLVGLGLDGLRAFAWILIATACLSVFAALYGSLRSRRRDLAMLRCLGATKIDVFLAILSEGLLLSAAGIAFGYLLGHSSVLMLGAWLESDRGVTLAELQWAQGETGLLLVLLGVSLVSAAIPAIQAYRTDVARTLAEGGV